MDGADAAAYIEAQGIKESSTWWAERLLVLGLVTLFPHFFLSPKARAAAVLGEAGTLELKWEEEDRSEEEGVVGEYVAVK